MKSLSFYNSVTVFDCKKRLGKRRNKLAKSQNDAGNNGTILGFQRLYLVF